MASELAAYYVSIVPSAKGLTKSIGREFAGIDNEASKAGKSSGGAFSGAFKSSLAGIGAVFAAAGIGSFVSNAVKGAGDIEQSFGALDSVFKGSSGDMRKWSKQAATSVGLTSNEFNELGTLIGSQLKNGGTAMDELAPKTNELITLGADLSSMFGGSAKDAVDALSSALKGERDPIERYGVSLNQAKIDAEAAALGFEKVEGALSAEATQAATMSLIMKQTSDAHGNFAKESDTFAHKQQVMSAQWGDLTTKVGELFLPTITGLIGFFSEKAMPVIGEVVGGVKAFAGAFKAADGDITSNGFPGFMERVGDAARGIYDLFTKGDYTGALSRAFAWEEDHPAVVGILKIRDGAQGLYDLLVKGDYNGALQRAFGWEEDSPFVDALLDMRETALKIPGSLAGVTKAMWDMRVPIGIVAGLIISALIPHWIALGIEALKSAAKQKVAWVVARTEAAKAALAHSAAVTKMVIGWALMATTAMINAAKIAASWLIALGPVGWLILAVAAIGGAIWAAYENIGWFRDGVDAAFKWVSEAVGVAFGWIQEVIGGVVDWFTGTLIPAWDTAVKSVGDFFTWLYVTAIKPVFDGVQAVIQGVVTWFQTVVVPGFQMAVGFLVAVFQGIYNFLKPVFDSIGVIIGGFYMFFEGVFNLVVAIIQKVVIPLFMGFWNRIVEAFTGIGKAVSDWWNSTVAPIFNAVASFIQTVVVPAFQRIWHTVQQVFNDVKNAIMRFWYTNVKPIFDGIANFFKTVVVPAFQQIWHTVQQVFNDIRNAIMRFWYTNVKPIFDGIGNFLRDTFGPVFTWLGKFIGAVWYGIQENIKKVWYQNIKPVFDTLSKFIKETIPKAFDQGVKAVKTAWDKMIEIAKAPVRFVINTVINDGLIKGFNDLARPLGVKELGKVALPAGFHDGGYTGRLHHNAVAGVVHGDEHVIKSASRRKFEAKHPGALEHINQTGTMPAGMPGAMAGEPGYFSSPKINLMRNLGRAFVRPLSGIDMHGAARAWNGASRLRISAGMGAPGINTGWAGLPSNIYAWARMSSGEGNDIDFNTQGPFPGVSAGMKRAVAIHEIGHVLGLQHTRNHASVMHPNVSSSWRPTAFDVANLQRIYGAPGVPYVPAKPGVGNDTGDGGWNPLAGIVDGLVQKFKDSFKDAGVFADLAIGIGKKIIADVSGWVGKKFGFGGDSSATATLYDGGGWLENTGGAQLVQHNKRKPDAVLSSGQWDTMTRIADNAKGGFNNYGTINVRDEEEAARIILTRQRDAQAAYGF